MLEELEAMWNEVAGLDSSSKEVCENEERLMERLEALTVAASESFPPHGGSENLAPAAEPVELAEKVDFGDGFRSSTVNDKALKPIIESLTNLLNTERQRRSEVVQEVHDLYNQVSSIAALLADAEWAEEFEKLQMETSVYRHRDALRTLQSRMDVVKQERALIIKNLNGQIREIEEELGDREETEEPVKQIVETCLSTKALDSLKSILASLEEEKTERIKTIWRSCLDILDIQSQCKDSVEYLPQPEHGIPILLERVSDFRKSTTSMEDPGSLKTFTTLLHTIQFPLHKSSISLLH
ncbi:hypothetical protein HDV05_002631, partial [Chytridiales sp. JEL 0842]